MQRSCSVPGHGAPKSDKYPSSQRTKSLGETDAQRDLQSRTRPCRAGEPHWVLWGPGQRPGGSQMGLQSCILRARYAGERWGAGSGDAARAEPGLKKSQGPARAAPLPLGLLLRPLHPPRGVPGCTTPPSAGSRSCRAIPQASPCHRSVCTCPSRSSAQGCLL